ncbi:hypothetical protein DLR74_18315 [Vibrio paracholerae]|nr:hypothetical protein DLR74_18315 [Vibrio paracholerae]
MLEGLGQLFPFKRGNRISVLNSKFYSGTTEQYEKLYKSLFTYQQATPFEWDNRIVERRTLETSQEQINSISMIRRVEFSSPFINKGVQQDMVVFDLDSNTIYQNTSNRFGLVDSLRVYEELYQNNSRLTTELQRYF